jgi:hypothetical protein
MPPGAVRKAPNALAHHARMPVERNVVIDFPDVQTLSNQLRLLSGQNLHICHKSVQVFGLLLRDNLTDHKFKRQGPDVRRFEMVGVQ